MISLVDDPENYTLEELVQIYLDAGYDQESAEGYAGMLKEPPEGVNFN
ncbi:hypothetical protein [Nocardiopsis deserti]|nr:hypothetical protein [Nocardiopsis deserti]